VSLRFQADADLNLAIVLALTRKEPGVDFRTAFEAGFAGLRDDQVLAAAARAGRLLVSHDRKTMPIHFGELVQGGGQSAGVVLVPQHMSVSDAAEWLLLIWATMEAEEWVNRLSFLPL
jgi:Domain of unknown function (DUF5615)